MNLLSPDQLREVAAMVALQIAPPEVMSAKDAAAFLRMSADRFFWWRKRYGVKPCSYGRFALADLKAGLEREARQTYQPAKAEATAP